MKHNMYDKVYGFSLSLSLSLSLKNEEKRESTVQKVAGCDSSKKHIMGKHQSHEDPSLR